MIIILIVVLSLTVRYKLGFGFSLVFVPLATLVFGFDDAFRIAIALEVVAGILMAYEFARYLRLLDAAALKIASLIGLGLGMLSKTYFPRPFIVVFSMVVVMAICVYSIKRLHVKTSRSPGRLLVAGVCSGFLNSWTSLSGPPVVIYYLRTEDSSDRIKGLLSGYFLILYIVTFIWLISNREYQGFEKWNAVLLGSITIALGYLPVRALSKRIHFDLGTGALVFILLCAAGVILKELF